MPDDTTTTTDTPTDAIEVDDAAVTDTTKTREELGDEVSNSGSVRPDSQVADTGKEALRIERAARANAQKQLKAAEEKLKKIEDQGKSELQKETEARAAAEKRAEKAEAKALRVEVAIKKKLPVEMAHRLIGDDQDTLEKDAEKLLKSVVPATGSLDQGVRTTSGKARTMNDFIREGLAK
jgi:hypothetical protein